MTTPDPTTPALLSAARPVLAWTKQDEIQGRPDEWEAYAGPYRLRVERRGENDYQDADGDSTPHPDLATAQLAAEALCRARLPLNMAEDQRALAALTPPAAPDGEALGRAVADVVEAHDYRPAHDDPGIGPAVLTRSMCERIGTALHAIGYAAGRSEGEAERAAERARFEDDAAIERDDADAEIARLTAELAAAHDRALAHGVAVVASTERAMQVQIDAMAAELAEARATTERANENEAVAREMMTKCADREMATLAAWVRAKEAAEDDARREGAREERRLCMADAQEVEDEARGNSEAGAVAGALRVKMAICARGEGQGS